MCICGSSALEGFHKHLWKLFPSFHTVPLLATCLLALYVYRWNVDRAAERGLISEEYTDWYDHDLVMELQDMNIPGVDRLHDDFVNFEDYLSTGKTFFMPIVKMMEQLQEGNDCQFNNDDECEEVADLSASMEFAALREQQQ
jgi:hypothetical protein